MRDRDATKFEHIIFILKSRYFDCSKNTDLLCLSTDFVIVLRVTGLVSLVTDVVAMIAVLVVVVFALIFVVGVVVLVVVE